MEPLDNPIWHALTSVQASLAEVRGDAARFPAAMTALAGLRAPSTGALDDLAALVAASAPVGLFLDRPLDPLPRSLRPMERDVLLQMVYEGPAAAADAADIVPLTSADVPAMTVLAGRAKPGPFGARTAELGDFLGIRDGGALVAMVGQRLRLEGLIEVSAVGTDPDHLGRGHGARLMAAMVELIRSSGSIPFLHVREGNLRAIALYERGGFVTRRRIDYLVVAATVD